MIVRTATRCLATPPGATGAPAGLSASSPGGGDYSDHVEGRHRPITAEAGHKFRDDFTDQPRVVLIGRPFAAPFLFIPFHCSEIPDARQ